MKTTKKRSFKRDLYPVKDNLARSDEEVAVIVDVGNGVEYYMFQIDSFKIDKRSYVVMIPYEPAQVKRRDAEIIILRSHISKDGDQLYISIKNKKELEIAFETFYERFEESGSK
jgi:uncharacterized protein YrzB (UPF0473 family)